MKKMTKNSKNKWRRAAEFHLVDVFKVPELTVSKIIEVLNLETLIKFRSSLLTL